MFNKGIKIQITNIDSFVKYNKNNISPLNTYLKFICDIRDKNKHASKIELIESAYEISLKVLIL